jgi:hypothetical protein
MAPAAWHRLATERKVGANREREDDENGKRFLFASGSLLSKMSKLQSGPCVPGYDRTVPSGQRAESLKPIWCPAFATEYVIVSGALN